MSEENTVQINESPEIQLASRVDRFIAVLIDGLCIGIVTLPVAYFTGAFDGISTGVKPSSTHSMLIGVLGMVVFAVINYKLLLTKGQTIGKQLMEIKIVDLDGNLPKINDHIIKRYLCYFIPGNLPPIGPFFSLINVLFIFGNDRRCLHDLFAKTRVVTAKNNQS